MTPASQHAAQIVKLLNEQYQETTHLLKVLQQEHAALEQRDLAAFDQLLEKKQQHVSQLEKKERELLNGLAALTGAPCNKQRVAAFFTQNQDLSLSHAWNELRDLLKVCQKQNTVNQRIMDASRISLQQSLNILRGESPTTKTYQPSGKTAENRTQGQFIAHA